MYLDLFTPLERKALKKRIKDSKSYAMRMTLQKKVDEGDQG